MSIASMVDAKLIREQAADPNPPSPVGVSTNLVNQLTRWIPSETITLYVAILALFGDIKLTATQRVCDLSFTGRTGAVIGGGVASAALALLLTYGKARTNKKAFAWPIFEIIAAPTAFVAWALALPATPLLHYCSYDAKWGALIVTGTTIAIAVVAYALGKSPDYEQVVTS
jgi:hypothetical protein